jgi:hypothetical protein
MREIEMMLWQREARKLRERRQLESQPETAERNF